MRQNNKRRDFSVFSSYRVRADGCTCLLRETMNIDLSTYPERNQVFPVFKIKVCFTNAMKRRIQNRVLARFRRHLFGIKRI